MASYFYACHLEKQWHAARPETKEQLERYLTLSIEHVIDPKTSMWGHDQKLAANERMVQYLILGTQPLDVIYDDQNHIQLILTSYE